MIFSSSARCAETIAGARTKVSAPAKVASRARLRFLCGMLVNKNLDD
jgi:hypothetical protein